MTYVSDNRPVTFTCHSDGSGFDVSSPGGDLAEGTGYFDKFPLLTIDLDTDGRILVVANALDSATGTLERDVRFGLERWESEHEMRWSLTFTGSEEAIQTARRSVHPAESTHRNNLTLIAYRDAAGEVVRFEVVSTLR